MAHACSFYQLSDASGQSAQVFFRRPGRAPQVLDLARDGEKWRPVGLRESSEIAHANAAEKLAALPAAQAEALWADWVAGLAADHVELFRQPNAFEPGKSVIPPSGKVVGAKETELMTRSAMEAWLTTGRFNATFETRLAAAMKRPKALTVNSGSSANLVALSALCSPSLGPDALRPGDEVITAAAGFPTTVNPILNNQLVPVFVDSERSGNIDVELIEAAIGPKTRAIMAAHTLGNPMRMDRIMEIARKHKLWVVEDCCDALGGTFGGQLVGTFGDMATLSFYPAHHITMGEGGAVFPSTPELAKAAESIRDWGRDCYCGPGCDNTCGKRFGWQLGNLPAGYDHKYTYSNLGYNLKISDMQAACGVAQLDRLDGFVQKRRENHAWLLARLRELGVDEFMELPEATPGSDPSWFGFLLLLRPEAQASRKELLEYLEERRIGTRLLFAGNLTRQPYFEGRPFRQAGELPMADRLMNDAFWVGIWPGLDEAPLEFVAQTLAAYFGLGDNW
jgi:CDP-4-dehydro-6-deoxyglucose reductase, E1